MTNKTYYIKISPRGYTHETFIACGTKSQVGKASAYWGDNPSAWSKPLKASHADIRKAKAQFERDGGKFNHYSAIAPLDDHGGIDYSKMHQYG